MHSARGLGVGPQDALRRWTVSGDRRTPSWRDLRGELRAMRAVPVRVKGSHETWRFEDGETFVVVRNHLGASIPVGIVAKFRRLRRRRGGRVGDEPALLGRTGPRWSRSLRVSPIKTKEGRSWLRDPMAVARAATAVQATPEAAEKEGKVATCPAGRGIRPVVAAATRRPRSRAK